MTELLQPKDSLMKLLLSTPLQVQSQSLDNLTLSQSGNGTTAYDNNDDGNKLINYFQQSSSSVEKEPDIVMMDHSYCRPWNWRPETSYMRPTKCVFVWKNSGLNTVTKTGIIDVTSGSQPEPTPVYDVEKARSLMEESEKSISSIKNINEDNFEDWETKIPRLSWTSTQNQLFTNIIKILDQDRLGRLTYEGSWNEPVLRRNIVDKSVSRTRSVLAGISWDTKLTQWLHGILLDYLPRSYLIAYLDILQSLRVKLPSLIDRMIWGKGPSIRRPWEPGAPLSRARPPPQLPSPQPIFLMAPCGGPRAHKWATLLAQLGPIVQTQPPVQLGISSDLMPATADRALAAVRARVAETRGGNSERPIVLVGSGAGAAIALQAADAERVACCICLGPALLTAEGRRGDPDDTALLDAQCPVLLVIGQCAHRCTREIAEDIRERMRVRTGLVIVGSADDHLRMAKSRRRRHGVMQAVVDRCVLDEIAEFVGWILSSPPMPQQPAQQAQGQQQIGTPPPPPPPVKISRPVGRPPGSGRKKHLLPPPPLPRPRHRMPSPSYLPIPPLPPWFMHRHSKHRRHNHDPFSVQQQKPSVSTGQIIVNNREQRTSVKVLDTSTPNRRTVDLSKVTLVNSATSQPQSRPSQQHSVLVLADGTRCIRTTPSQPSQVTRLVPTRRQVTTNVRPTIQQPQLTPSEILDLPIIFADNDTPLLTETDNVIEPPVVQPVSHSQHKYVLINKHGIQSGKRSSSSSNQIHSSQPKYARIIINNSTQQPPPQQIAQPQQVQFEFVDLETELKTNTVPKPPHQIPMNDPD